jgi:hypothetical protein
LVDALIKIGYINPLGDNLVQSDKLDKYDLVMEKTKIEVEAEIVNEMIKLREVEDTYSDVMSRPPFDPEKNEVDGIELELIPLRLCK